ncbi:MAG TPA: hypothetical protein VFQ88_07285 [Nevskiaceae bacterium]|nr:hypothetical protein [Nevskiaceae bacterium]
MPSFTIFDGCRSRRALGARQTRIALFAFDAPCWHYASSHPSDRRAVRALAAKGMLRLSHRGRDLMYRYIPGRHETGWSLSR